MLRFVSGLFVFVSLAAAQSTDAVVSGTVVDPSGASVPGASVRALNINTGVATTVVSNASGIYQLSALPPGDYRISAEMSGFKKLVLNDQTLRVGDRVTLDLKLEVGQPAESVEVTADSEAAISYITTSVGGVINQQRVQDLPVSSRNAMDLVLTQAGLNGANFAGGRIGQLNITLDGINNQDNVINSGLGASTVFTSIDRIDEVKVLTAPADAEYGRGSGQIQLISRSGTNAFHGSLYEFNRNVKLAANTWSNNRNATPKNPLNRNQAGARVGGPIRKNKTFFFGLFEAQIIRQASVVTATTLTDQARNGTFRFYPGVQNGNANANNPTVDTVGNPVMPTGATGPLQSINIFGRDPLRMTADPSGLIAKYISVLPSPNYFRTGDGLNTAGFQWQRPNPDDTYSMDLRIDHNFNSQHRLSGSYNRDHETIPIAGFLSPPVPTAPASPYTGTAHSVSVTLTSSLRPNLLSEFHAGMARYFARFIAPWEADASGPGILPKIGNQPFLFTPPVVSGTTTLVTAPIPTSNDPQARKSPIYQYAENLSWLRGSHAIKTGIEARFPSGNGYVSFSVLPRVALGNGNAAFTNFDTTAISGIGQNLANARLLLSLLSGTVSSVSQTFNSPGGANPQYLNGESVQRTWRQREVATYVKDDYKVAKNLTLHLGVRWEYYGIPYEANGRFTGLAGGSGSVFGLSGTNFGAMFNPSANGGSLTQLQLIGRNSPNPSVQPYNRDWNNFAPAVGLSWSLPWFGKDKTVFRMGYGIGYEREGFVLLDDTNGFGQAGLTEADSVTTANYVNLVNQGSPVVPLTPQGKPLSVLPLNDRTQRINIYDNGMRTPYVQNWNVGIGRQLFKGVLLDVRYVGSKGTKLIRGSNVNEVNTIENGIMDAFRTTMAGGNAPLLDKVFNGLNVPGLGAVNGTTVRGSDAVRNISTLNAYLVNNDVGGFGQLINSSVYYTNVHGGLLTNGGLPPNFITANPQYLTAELLGNYANSTYNSLQVEVTRRFANGLSYQGSYVFSKTLGEDDGGSQSLVSSYITSRNRRLDKHLLGYDIPHIFRNSGTFELPFGRGRKWLNSGHGIMRHLLEKWEIGAIFNKFAGTPLNLSDSFGTTFNSVAVTPMAYGAIPKNFGEVVKSGNNVVYFQGWTQVADPIRQNLPASLQSQATQLAIADASGKILIGNPVLGSTGGVGVNLLRGPGSFSLNADIIKRVAIKENGLGLEFRADFINPTNTPQWGAPNANIDSTSFGQITSATGNRLIVLGARINF
jgi:hypothetical protein